MSENILSVSQVNAYISSLFQKDRLLSGIYMKGEISNCKYHVSGHVYFTLKDEGGQIACVMFSRYVHELTFRLKEGQGVVVFGSINVYERDGKYQMYVTGVRQDGLGILYERYEQLKAKLEREGLFAQEHKKSIPMYAKRVGIVTAKTGAAIRDIVSISKRRNPYCSLILYPAQVQGDGAAESIVRGLKRLDAMDLDVIIAGRGGGSIEDLWAFNEEIVARAIYECKTPVISAVGHETDFTIADFVADLRVPTPSAAAEMAVIDIRTVQSALVDYHSELYGLMLAKLENSRKKTEYYELKLKMSDPERIIRDKKIRLISYEEKMEALIRRHVQAARHKLDIKIEKLNGVSPLNRLLSGYSYVSDTDGNNVRTINDVSEGKTLEIYFSDGKVTAEAKKISKYE